MARKGKLWNKLFSKEPDKKDPELDDSVMAADNSYDTDHRRSVIESELIGIESPKEPCHFCYEKIELDDLVYKCSNCEILYHYPDCIKNQHNCRACGEKILLKGNIAKVLKFRSVICPNCGMKIKLFFSPGPKLHITCPNCGHEGHLPNPYLKELKLPKVDGSKENDLELADSGHPVEEEDNDIIDDELEVWVDDDSPDVDDDIEIEDALVDVGDMGDVDNEEIHDLDLESSERENGPKIIKHDKHSKRKPKLVTLDRKTTCNICITDIGMGLPVVVCKCGDKYHESCASEIGLCPTCDGSLQDIIHLVEEEDLQYEPEVESELEPILEPEEDSEPKLEIGTEMDTTLTFENLELDRQSKIIKSIGEGIAKAPGLEFNFVYIYGTNSEVMTHFLFAIGNYILYNETELKVRYTTLEKFFKEHEQALELDKLELFEEFYSEADVLLLDNFSEIHKKTKEKEKFFKIFETLVEDNKQLVLAGSAPLDEIAGLDKRSAKRISDLTDLNIHLK